MSELLVETRGQSGWLILNRPKAFNSLTRTILDDLAIALTDFEQDDNIRVVVLAATDCPAFCAGADLKQVLEKADELDVKDPFLAYEYLNEVKQTRFAELNAFDQATILNKLANYKVFLGDYEFANELNNSA